MDIGQFSIDLHGAYVTRLETADGTPILYPRTIIDGKRRGGMHVCLPQFGPDAAGTLPQHGYGRDHPWRAIESSETSVTLVLDKPMPGFEDLQATLTYAYKQTGFEAILKVKNTGEIALRVSPGLHPYFAITGRPELNGRVIDTTLTDETEFMQTEVHQLKTGLLDPILSSQDLTTWAVWSGKSPDYLCVEPTQNGNSFSEKAISASELLEPGQSRQYTFQIQW